MENKGEKKVSKFSDILEQYITQAGVSENQLAKASGFSRSYVARLKNGQRISPDAEKMVKLFEVLNLNSEEYAEVWDLYLEEQQGKETYKLTKAVLEFIDSFRMVSRLSADMKINYSIPDVRVINGRADVNYMIKLLVEKEAAEGEGKLRVLVQPEQNSVMEALKSGFKINSNFKAEHLVCLENRVEKDKNTFYNIKLLEKIVPLILCEENNDYNVYYYYNRVDQQFNKFSLMPYCIITSDRVISMDWELEHAAIYQEKEIREFFVAAFEKMREECKRLYMPIKEQNDMLNMFMQRKEVVCDIYSMGSQPCMGILDISELFEKYAVDPLAPEIIALGNCLKNWRKSILEKQHKMVTYFTKEGVQRFMESGRVDELMDEVYHPIQPADRRKMVSGLLKMTEKGFCEPRLIQDKRYRYTEKLYIIGYNIDDALLYYNTSQHFFSVKEKTLARLFYEFLEFFKESVYVCTVEETVEYLKELIK